MGYPDDSDGKESGTLDLSLQCTDFSLVGTLGLNYGTGCHDLSFLNVELKANFFTLLFHFHQEAL